MIENRKDAGIHDGGQEKTGKRRRGESRKDERTEKWWKMGKPGSTNSPQMVALTSKVHIVKLEGSKSGHDREHRESSIA